MKKRGQSKTRMTNVGHPPLPAKPEGSGPFQHLKGLLLLRSSMTVLKHICITEKALGALLRGHDVDQSCKSAQSVLGITASGTWREMTKVNPHPISASPHGLLQVTGQILLHHCNVS